MDALEQLESLIVSNGKRTDFPNAMPLSNNASFYCEGKATVQPYVTFDGPIFLGENAFIGPYCFLRGPLYIGKNVMIGAYSEIKRSLIMDGAAIAHRNIIPDCVIGRDCWLAGGVMITNLRIDKRPVRLTVRGEEKSASRFGLYIEEKSILGVGVVAMPGTHVKAGVTVYGPSTIKGVVE